MNDLENKAQIRVLALGPVIATSLPLSLQDSQLCFASVFVSITYKTLLEI